MQPLKLFYRKYMFWLGLISFLALITLQTLGHPEKYSGRWWLALGFSILTLIFFLTVGWQAAKITHHDNHRF